MTTINPSFRYRDAKKAISWLQEAFGMEPGSVTMDGGDQIAHAELFYGDGCIMLGSAGELYPWEAPAGVACVYGVISDVDAHCARAKAAGAEILYGPQDTDYGSREYGAKDVEGNIWSFGTYRAERP